jgi:large subunit ribosomal protein L4
LGRPGGKNAVIKPLEEVASLDKLPSEFKKFTERFKRLEGGKGIQVLEEYSIMWRANQRKGFASTKTRAEVRGGGKKPYQQKGSGRARRGSSRSPLIRGGGVIFGPKPKSWRIRMNEKAKRLAFERAIFESVVSGRMEMIKQSQLPTEGKTKEAVDLIKQYVPPVPNNPRFVLVVSQDELTVPLRRAEGNVQSLTVFPADTVCAYDVIRADKLLITKQGLNKVMERFGIYKNEADAPPKQLSQSEKLLQVATAPMYVKEGEEEPKSMFMHPKGPVGRKIKGEGPGFHGIYRKGSKGFKGWKQFFRTKHGDQWKNQHVSGSGKK